MNSLTKRFYFLLVLILTLGLSSCSARHFDKSGGKSAEKKLFNKSISERIGLFVKSAVKFPAKVKQGFRERKLELEYEKSIKLAQKRAFDMQTPEVQARMIKDKIKTDQIYKEKQKNRKAKFKKPEIKNLNADNK